MRSVRLPPGAERVVNIYHSTARGDSVAAESCPVDDFGGFKAYGTSRTQMPTTT